MTAPDPHSERHSRLLHAFAVLTAVAALLPILVGAITTTLDAGMAFPDWPTSDGYGMLSYPWLRSAGHKFVEHGHRLAGMLIGLISIGLVVVAMRCEHRRRVQALAWVILLAVICQGLLGGGRVRLDARVLAMIHGSFAAIVFSLMGVLALVTGRGWKQPLREEKTRASREPAHDAGSLRGLAVVTTGLVLCQFLAGGFVRHLHTALHEHLGLAVLVTILSAVLTVRAIRSRLRWLRRPALWLGGLVAVQLLLGAGAWITRFGLASAGYVAVQHSSAQLWLRTAHTLGGMLILMTAVTLTCRIFRLSSVSNLSIASRPAEAPLPRGTTVTGGAA